MKSGLGFVALAGLLCALAGCATPQTTLRNASGQTVTCGGGVGGSLMGGLIGHNIEKNSDQKCVQQYEAAGYKRVD